MNNAAPPETSELDRALALEPGCAQGSYTGELTDGWRIGPAVNGGLLLAMIGQALRLELGTEGHHDPLVMSAYYLSAAEPGPVSLETALVRRGRTVTTGQASLCQPDAEGRRVERIRALATYGDLGGLSDDVRTSASPPDMPPPEECLAAGDGPVTEADVPLLGRFDLRIDPATAGWAIGKPAGRGVIQGWLRLADGREPDPLALLLALDALPPVAFDLGVPGWAPTLELSAHLRARPAPGWLQVKAWTANFAGGLFEEDAEVWDSAGRLVAQSRQLARAGRTRAP